MRYDDQYTAIIGDLLIERYRPEEDHTPILNRTDDGPEVVLVAAIPDGAACGIGEADGYARLFARAPTMLRRLAEALTLFAAEFDGDESIDGGGALIGTPKKAASAGAERGDPPIRFVAACVADR